MGLLTRGLGPSASLLTAGMGPPPPTDDILSLVRGRRPKVKPRGYFESVDIFTVTAKLLSVNGITPKHSISGKQKGLIDNSVTSSLKLTGKVRIIKTRPTNNILINVTEAYRKK